jgi:dihydroorotase
VLDAIERGVVLDVGHGAGSFSWDVAERAMAQGIQPQTISSDLHIYSVGGPVYDLATVVSKFLHLGIGLDDVIAKVTAVPARLIGRPGRIGTLAVGAWGDAVICELRDGDFPLVDTHGEVRAGKQSLVPVTVVKGGRRVT